MSSNPVYSGPFDSLSVFQGQTDLQALALTGFPSGLVTVAGLDPFRVPVPAGGINWAALGGTGGLGGLVTLYGEVLWDLSQLLADSVVVAVAIVGGPDQEYPVQLVALSPPLPVSPGAAVATAQIVLQALVQPGGD